MVKDSDISKILSELKSISKKSANNVHDSAKVQHSVEQISPDFIFDLGKKSISKTDKELTLGEYLQKYNQVDQAIDSERVARTNVKSDYQKIVNFIEGNEPKKISNDTQKKQLFIANNIEEQIDTSFTSKEKKTVKRETNNNLQERKSNYANTKASISKEANMSPLRLKQYNSED